MTEIKKFLILFFFFQRIMIYDIWEWHSAVIVSYYLAAVCDVCTDKHLNSYLISLMVLTPERKVALYIKLCNAAHMIEQFLCKPELN